MAYTNHCKAFVTACLLGAIFLPGSVVFLPKVLLSEIQVNAQGLGFLQIGGDGNETPDKMLAEEQSDEQVGLGGISSWGKSFSGQKGTPAPQAMQQQNQPPRLYQPPQQYQKQYQQPREYQPPQQQPPQQKQQQRPAVESNSDEMESCLKIATAQLETGNYEGAKSYYQRILNQYDPNSLQAMLGIAKAEMEQDNWSRALGWYRHAIQKHPGVPAIYNAAGIYWGRREDYVKSRELLEKAVTAEPKNKNYRENLALTILNQGDYKASLNQLSMVYEPERCYYILGLWSMEQKNLIFARKCFFAAQRLCPEQPEIARKLNELDRFMAISRQQLLAEAAAIVSPTPQQLSENAPRSQKATTTQRYGQEIVPVLPNAIEDDPTFRR